MTTTTSAVRKPTKAQMFASLLEMPGLTDAQVAFIKHEMELLAKKNTADKKPTAQQVANDGFMETILAVIDANGAPMTVSEIQKADPTLEGLTNQRISALIRKLGKDGTGELTRLEIKRKAYFQLTAKVEDAAEVEE